MGYEKKKKDDGPMILLLFGLVGLYFWGEYLDRRFDQNVP